MLVMPDNGNQFCEEGHTHKGAFKELQVVIANRPHWFALHTSKHTDTFQHVHTCKLHIFPVGILPGVCDIMCDGGITRELHACLFFMFCNIPRDCALVRGRKTSGNLKELKGSFACLFTFPSDHIRIFLCHHTVTMDRVEHSP